MHANSENRRVAFLQIGILAQLALCLYGSANLLLESPYLASLFWAGMGTGLRMIKKLDLERSLQSLLSRHNLGASHFAHRVCTNECEAGRARDYGGAGDHETNGSGDLHRAELLMRGLVFDRERKRGIRARRRTRRILHRRR